MITPRLVASLGLAQLVLWGVSYYLIGVLGDEMAQELGWSRTAVYGGFAVALVVMGLLSGAIGRAIDRFGGRRVMTAGSLLTVVGCIGLALAHDTATYLTAWACLGAAMRATLYEAAFAALVRIGGAGARPAISQITLLGGLASSVFWPIGHALAGALGWRGAVVCYGLFALATVPIHRSIPDARYGGPPPDGPPVPPPLAASRRDRVVAASLYATAVTLTAFLAAGMSSHMIGIMAGLGTGAGLAVWLSTLRGIGQSGARLCEVMFGRTLSPLVLGVIATALLPACFVVGLFGGVSAMAGAGFALAYGAGNGLLTIVRGTQPLVLFDHRTYGGLVGRLTAASFFVSALAPVAYAAVIDGPGPAVALIGSAAIGALVLACTAGTWWLFHRRAS
ncbi:MAG: MFS transporter [Rhodoplanes sp.]|uniref:MFS transporter n=1 Tax=Rhodoplanes sp. TaxID=1968906 RepID=UPI0017E2D969|nr:MFS transporter [Rhodoplanes sp.]NVO13577.1 MFS transporter [Rhodoplanes sp.]